jgi:hypothetical protein
MADNSPRFVPKVHPATRPVEPEDPYTLHATAVEGNPEVLVRAVVQEYAWIGWDVDEIAALFRDPFYPLLHSLWRALGEAGIRARLDAAFQQFGVFRFQSRIVEAPEEIEPELVQIAASVLRDSGGSPISAGPAGPGGSSHAQRL